MEQQSPVQRPRRTQLAILSGALALSVLGAGAVAAQTPASPAPSPSTVTPGQGPGGGPTMTGPGGRGPVMRHFRGPGSQFEGGMRQGGRGPRFQQLPPFSGGGRGWSTSPGAGMPGQAGLGARVGRSLITVTAVAAPTISLATADGWTRDIDTTNVVITRNGQTITLADVTVGDRVRIDETRNADGSYTVTGIEVLPAVVSGTVATVGTDSFTVTTSDGSTVTVTTSDATQWLGRRGSVAGVGSLTVGGSVIAIGTTAADGSLTATAVMARGVPALRPNQPGMPNTPDVPGASPAASPATQG